MIENHCDKWNMHREYKYKYVHCNRWTNKVVSVFCSEVREWTMTHELYEEYVGSLHSGTKWEVQLQTLIVVSYQCQLRSLFFFLKCKKKTHFPMILFSSSLLYLSCIWLGIIDHLPCCLRSTLFQISAVFQWAMTNVSDCVQFELHPSLMLMI